MDTNSLINLNGLQKLLRDVESQILHLRSQATAQEEVLRVKASQTEVRELTDDLNSTLETIRTSTLENHTSLLATKTEILSKLLQLRDDCNGILKSMYSKAETEGLISEELKKLHLQICLQKVSRSEWNVVKSEIVELLTKLKDLESRLNCKLERSEILEIKETAAKVETFDEALSLVLSSVDKLKQVTTDQESKIGTQVSDISQVKVQCTKLESDLKQFFDGNFRELLVSKQDITDLGFSLTSLSDERSRDTDEVRRKIEETATKQDQQERLVNDLEDKVLSLEEKNKALMKTQCHLQGRCQEAKETLQAIDPWRTGLESALSLQREQNSMLTGQVQGLYLELQQQRQLMTELKKKADLSLKFISWFSKSQQTEPPTF